MNGRRQLAILTHRANVGHLGKDRRGGSGRWYRPGTRRKIVAGERGVIIAGGLFGTLPETADGGLDALREGLPDIPDHMKMVRHEAIMEHLYHGIMSRYLADTFENSLGEVGIGDPSLGGIVLGNEEFTKQRLMGCNRQGDMVESGALPCFAGFLPMPCVVIICHAGLYWSGRIVSAWNTKKTTLGDDDFVDCVDVVNEGGETGVEDRLPREG